MSKELEMLEAIDKKMDKAKEETGKELTEAKAELKSLKESATTLDAEVKKLNEELGKKGATVEQLQNEVKELKAKGGRIVTKVGVGQRIADIKAAIATVIGEKGEKFADEVKASGIKGIEIKSVGAISSANLATDNYISYLPAEPGQRPFGQMRFREMTSLVGSDTDNVQYPRQNTPVGEGSFGRQTTEGNPKAQVDYDWTMQSLTLTPLAGYAIVSRQSLRNIKFLQSYLPMNLMEDLQDTEDTDYANDLVAAATGSTTSTGSNEIEKIVHYIRNLRKTKFIPNGIAVDPDVWSDIILTTQTNAGYNLPNVVTVDANGTVRILGRPVYDVNWLTGGRILVGDWRKCAVVESEGLSLRQSDSHASTFVANQVTYLLERTSKLAVFRPDAFITAVI